MVMITITVTVNVTGSYLSYCNSTDDNGNSNDNVILKHKEIDHPLLVNQFAFFLLQIV